MDTPSYRDARTHLKIVLIDGRVSKKCLAFSNLLKVKGIGLVKVRVRKHVSSGWSVKIRSIKNHEKGVQSYPDLSQLLTSYGKPLYDKLKERSKTKRSSMVKSLTVLQMGSMSIDELRLKLWGKVSRDQKDPSLIWTKKIVRIR